MPDIEIPDLTLPELLLDTLKDDDLDRVAFEHVETGDRITFRRLVDQSDRLANWLTLQGIVPGDVIALMLPTCPDFAVALMGVLRAGATASLIPPHASVDEAARQLSATQARLLVTNSGQTLLAEQALDRAGRADVEILLADCATAKHHGWDRIEASEPNRPVISVDPATHVACLASSSGTSGLAKQVMLSHRNLVANVLQFATAIGQPTREDSLVAFLPYSHIYALTTNLSLGLLRRMTQFTMTSFQPGIFRRIMTDMRPSMLFVVPPVASLLVRRPNLLGQTPRTVRLIVSGAAALDARVGEQLALLTGAQVVQGYGMTETSPVTHVMTPGDSRQPLDSIGVPLPNVRVRVVDPNTGRDVANPEPGQWSAPGELWVNGPNTMLGYLQSQDGAGALLDTDGWVHTGDLVQTSDGGLTRVVGRLKELIKRRGLQIAPAHLEMVLLGHPDVLDAAVLGRPAADGDETVHALTVVEPGTDTAAVISWANAQLPAHARIDAIHEVDQLARSAAGKLLRLELEKLMISDQAK